MRIPIIVPIPMKYDGNGIDYEQLSTIGKLFLTCAFSAIIILLLLFAFVLCKYAESIKGKSIILSIDTFIILCILFQIYDLLFI